MHASSLENMHKCFTRYVDCEYFSKLETVSLIDIGGTDVNGSYKDIFSHPAFDYKVMDIAPGDNVDIVLEDPYYFPLPDNSVDIIISGQTLEHVEFFWCLFQEMVRVLNENGIILLIVPSAGPEHRYPVDCYRFYPDSLVALAKYTHCHLIDSWIDDRGPWNDLVGIFGRKKILRYQYCHKRYSYFTSHFQASTTPQLFTGTKNPEFENVTGGVHYLDVLKGVHELLVPKLYFEIGIRKGASLSLAQGHAVAIDPEPDPSFTAAENHQVFEMTSDAFFEWIAPEHMSGKIDFAFIDGMHLFEFALRDFINVEKYSTRNTVVVVDDILPNHRVQAQRNRMSNVWMGDIWKLWYCLKKYRPDLKLQQIDSHPSGLLLITNLNPENHTLRNNYNPIVRIYKNLSMDNFEDEIFARKYADPFTRTLLQTTILS